MSLSKYSKRRGQFEALEAKQLFAADLMGGDVTAVENLGCHFPPHNAVAETTGTEQHQCFSGKTDFHGNKTDFTISPNYVGGGQEGEPFLFDNLMVAPEGLVNNTSGMDSETEMVEFEHHNDLFANLGGQEGEPLHTAAHEAAHVVQQLGGQEGEPITEESAPVASIAPDGCVDLIGGAAIDLPDTAIVAEIDSSHTELVRADIMDPDDSPNLVDHVFEQYAQGTFAGSVDGLTIG